MSNFINEDKIITAQKAKLLGMLPLSIPIESPREYWILSNMIKDLERGGIAWCFVQEKYNSSTGISLWRATSNHKLK